MLLKYFYDEKLAHASYMVGCQATGDAIVIDPGRDIDRYLRAAEIEKMEIKAVTETHIHADFVSGSREISECTGAKMYLSDEGGADWKYQFTKDYACELLKDGDKWKVGNIEFEALHTPGHTPEHMSFMVTDTAGADKPMGVFTGDFVFVGDVGRPDLLESAAGITGTKEKSAKQLFGSLNQFNKLPDYLQIWPAHGAGSACGKALGAIPSTTLGYEKLFNWAFNVKNEDEFITSVLEGQHDPPTYFAMMKKINKEGPAVLHNLPNVPRLDTEKLVELSKNNEWIIDTRSHVAYGKGHIPDTIGITLDHTFTTYSGWVLPYDLPLYLVVEKEKLEEAVTSLIYIGLDNIQGYFTTEDIDRWAALTGQPLMTLPLARPGDVAEAIAQGKMKVLDVRTSEEYSNSQLPNSFHISLGDLLNRIDEIPKNEQIVVTCRTGGRSFVAATILQAHGYNNVMNLEGGKKAWVEEGFPMEDLG